MGVRARIYDICYWRYCRFYSRHFVKDKPADAILRLLCSLPFFILQRFWPSFVRPRRFSEKTLWSGDRPEEIPFDKLPSRFVIKANHGAGYNIIVRDKTQLNQEAARHQLKQWLAQNYCQDKFLGIEWAYRDIKPSIIIESFIEENGKLPTDYKFFCFSGRVERVVLYFDRFEKLAAKAFDRNFEPSELRFNVPEYAGEPKRPPNFDKMIEVAESLAEGFRFIRVDMYNLDGRILFGELTFYHGGTGYVFRPERQDYALGEKWKS